MYAFDTYQLLYIYSFLGEYKYFTRYKYIIETISFYYNEFCTKNETTNNNYAVVMISCET